MRRCLSLHRTRLAANGSERNRPAVGQIRKKVAELEEPRQVCGEVWNKIQHAITRYGSDEAAQNI